jgi:hypothetical protein
MSELVVRPDSWNFPLFLHVAGAMLLVAALTVTAGALVLAWSRRDGEASAVLMQFAWRTLLLAVIPSFLLMRIGAQWLADREGLADSDLAWIGIGYTTGDFGGILLVLTTIVAFFAARRGRRPGGAPNVLGRLSAVLVLLLVAAYLVTVWAMAAKPT